MPRFAMSARSSSALLSDTYVLRLDAPLRVRLRCASLASTQDDSTGDRTTITNQSTRSI